MRQTIVSARPECSAVYVEVPCDESKLTLAQAASSWLASLGLEKVN